MVKKTYFNSTWRIDLKSSFQILFSHVNHVAMLKFDTNNKINIETIKFIFQF